ncbi:CRC domain-containing protein TSO1 isoform X2 [Prunus avium]|uniref:CRC domain-containing protein TSO1 isoform X2 n=1 Tax=Prunus avium TaxID=42229 RepID=A0A6P5TKT6_PRUAV|nr:CRC domain-containing protein TSO1 isoform X2 [Prunus avium]
MDTPERNQIGTPKAKFEDSPVFNYINSLSPIKPVKSVHITQTFSSLSFASLPSVFTSPHVSAHKESRFLRRHNTSDPSKPESTLASGNKVSANEDAAQLYINSEELREDCVPGVSTGEDSVEPSSEHSKFVIELPRNLKYDCGSPDCDPTRCGTEAHCELEVADLSAPLVPYVQKTSEEGSSNDEGHLQIICQTVQRKEVTGCDWESLISDAADLLIFDSPNGTEAFKGLMQNSLDPVTRFCTSLAPQLTQNDVNDEQNVQVLDIVGSGGQLETEDPSSQYGEASQLERTEQMEGHLNHCMVSSQSEKEDNKVETPMQFNCKPAVLNLQRGLRRRCLDFEMAGARRKSLDNVSNSSSNMLSQSDEKITTNDKQLVPMKPGGESSRCILPGIGLHLNALAKTSKDYKIIKCESLAYDRQLSLPNSTADIHSPTGGQGPGHESFSSASSERDMDVAENGVQLAHDASQEPAFLANEEFNQNSPKKKRRRFEHAGETESCKRCNCKKSKCLKLYCECFAAGVYCIEPCSCQECFNKPIHEDTVLATRKQIESRNPLAFAPKVIRSSDSVPELGEESSKTPASARHKRGCNCKKSSCLKKYCECYQGGVGCSISCRCEGCKNAFGRKDGSFIGTEAELDEEEAEACEKSVAEKHQQKIEIQKNEEQRPDSALPTTPLRLSRQMVSLPFSSKNKPPRSSVFSIGGSSSGLYTSQKLGKPNILRPESKFERHSQTVPEDEMPEILQGDGSPSTGVKTASPNSKRVCPPNSDFGPSPGRRTGRKLILQSIPSFPSLTPQH